MSGECDKCGEHCLDCICAAKDYYRRMNSSSIPERFKCHLNRKIEHLEAKIVPFDEEEDSCDKPSA